MELIFFIYFLLSGLIIGSFLNVVIYRFNTGRTMLGRSKCFSCKRVLRWYDLIPLFSYIFQGGRCRTCKSRLSVQYPAVELLTGLLFLAVYQHYAYLADKIPSFFVASLVYALVQVSILVVILIYDIRHKIIPNVFVYVFSLLAFVALFWGIQPGGEFGLVLPSYTALAAGLVLAFPFYLIWLLSRGKWMGLGDAKLALGIGWFLGLSAGASAIMIGFWTGAVVSLAVLLLAEIFTGARRKNFLGVKFRLPILTLKSEIPFAPFLIIGLLTVFFLEYNVLAHLSLM